MVNSAMMYDVLGYPHDHPLFVTARGSLDKLLVIKDDEAVLPAVRVAGVGHGARRAHAARSRRRRSRTQQAAAGLEWLKPLQVLDVKGDWAERGRTYGPAAGRSNMPIRIIPISTIPLLW